MRARLPVEAGFVNSQALTPFPQRVVSHQQGMETPAGCEVKRESETTSARSEKHKNYCAELRKAAMEITTEILRQAQNDGNGADDTGKPKAESRKPTASIREGRIGSGDSFVASTAKRKWLRETFTADAVDMVSAGIAHVWEANVVPYVIIRMLSDNADESASQDFAGFIQSAKEPITVSTATLAT